MYANQNQRRNDNVVSLGNRKNLYTGGGYDYTSHLYEIIRQIRGYVCPVIEMCCRQRRDMLSFLRSFLASEGPHCA